MDKKQLIESIKKKHITFLEKRLGLSGYKLADVDCKIAVEETAKAIFDDLENGVTEYDLSGKTITLEYENSYKKAREKWLK